MWLRTELEPRMTTNHVDPTDTHSAPVVGAQCDGEPPQQEGTTMTTTTALSLNIPVPAGAIADDWPTVMPDGALVRSLVWLDLGAVEVSGYQYSDDGRIERGVSVYLPEDRHLSAAEARDLAAKLVEAATMLEGLQ